MILNKGELNGKRILKSETVDLMTKDHTANITRRPTASSKIIKVINGLCIDQEGTLNLEPGYGFGLGFCILNDPAAAGRTNLARSELFWTGYNSTYFFINPDYRLIGIFMTQVGGGSNPYSFYYGDKMREYTYQGIGGKKKGDSPCGKTETGLNIANLTSKSEGEGYSLPEIQEYRR